MYINPLCMLFITSLYLSRWVHTIATASGHHQLTPLESSGFDKCPSYCDGENYHHKEAQCPLKMFCCLVKNDMLECCSNVSYRITDSLPDEHNCYSNKFFAWLANYWKIVLGVCLPVGVISVVAAVTLCSLQSVRQRRHRQTQSELSTMDRTRSNSAASSLSGSSTSSGRLAAPVVVVTPEEGATHSSDIHTITLQPPPYTNDKPPQYSDVFPG